MSDLGRSSYTTNRIPIGYIKMDLCDNEEAWLSGILGIAIKNFTGNTVNLVRNFVLLENFSVKRGRQHRSSQPAWK